MNMKKIVAGAVASVMAVSTMAITASADKGIASTIGFKDDGNGNAQLFLLGDAAVAEIDITKIASFDLTLSFEDNGGEAWMGGAVVAQSDSLGWGVIGAFENAVGNGKDFEGIKSGTAFHVDMPKKFDAADTYAAITLQNYGIDYSIDAITIYDDAGAVLLALPKADAPATDAPATDAPATDASGDTNQPAPDKNQPDTGVEGVAIVAGLAILATGAIVIAKKRK